MKGTRRLLAVVLTALTLAAAGGAVAQPASAGIPPGYPPHAPILYDEPGSSLDGKFLELSYYPSGLDDAEPIDGYIVRRSGGSPVRDSGWTSGVLPPNAGVRYGTTMLTYLTPGTNYDVSVRAVNIYGESPDTTLTMHTDAVTPVPGAPTFYDPSEPRRTFAEAPNGTKQDVYLVDNDNTGTVPVNGFIVRRDGGTPVRDAGWTSPLIPNSSPYEQAYGGLTFTYLKPATTYTAYAKMVNDAGSGPEKSMTFRTASVPPAPAGTTAALLKGGVKLSWADPGDCIPYRSVEGEQPWCEATASNGGSAITGWKISRDGTDLSGVGATSTTVKRTDLNGGYVRVFNKTLTNLRPGSTYHVTVQALNKVGTGTAKTLTIVIPNVPSAPAIGTAVAGISGGAIDAKAVWAKPTNAGGTPSSYTVYAYRMSGTTVVETLTKTGVSASALSYTFPLTRTGSWRFRVKAINAAGTSAYSAYSNTVAGR